MRVVKEKGRAVRLLPDCETVLVNGKKKYVGELTESLAQYYNKVIDLYVRGQLPDGSYIIDSPDNYPDKVTIKDIARSFLLDRLMDRCSALGLKGCDSTKKVIVQKHNVLKELKEDSALHKEKATKYYNKYIQPFRTVV